MEHKEILEVTMEDNGNQNSLVTNISLNIYFYVPQK